MAEHLRRWGVVWFLVALWMLFLAIHGALEYGEAVKDAQDHRQPFAQGDWLREWTRSTFENLQSEVFQIALACVVVDQVAAKRKWFTASES